MVRIGDLLGAAATAALSANNVMKLKAGSGVPALNVLYTHDEVEARDFLNARMDSSVVGLDMTWKASSPEGSYPRSSLLQLAAGKSVLLFDLLPEPENGKPAQLPRKVCAFLQQTNRTFYDAVMTTHAARIAFELNCVVSRGVDLSSRGRAWPDLLPQASNITSLANQVLKTNLRSLDLAAWSKWEQRPLSKGQLRYLAQKTYLSWAVAERFLKKAGPASDDAKLTKLQIYKAGEALRKRGRGLPQRKTRFDWSTVKAAGEERQPVALTGAATKTAKKTTTKTKQAEKKAASKSSSVASEKTQKSRAAKAAKKAEAKKEAEEAAALEARKQRRRERSQKRRAAKAEEEEAAAEAAKKELKREKNKQRRAAKAAKKAEEAAAAEEAAKLEAKRQRKREKNSKQRAAKEAKKAEDEAATAEAAKKELKREKNKQRRAAKAAKKAEEAAAAEEAAKVEARKQRRRERNQKRRAAKAEEAAEAVKKELKREKNKKRRAAKATKQVA